MSTATSPGLVGPPPLLTVFLSSLLCWGPALLAPPRAAAEPKRLETDAPVVLRALPDELGKLGLPFAEVGPGQTSAEVPDRPWSAEPRGPLSPALVAALRGAGARHLVLGEGRPPDELALLADWPELAGIYVFRSGFSDEALACLGACRGLRQVVLIAPGSCGPRALAALAQLPALRALSLEDCPDLRDYGSLSEATRLTTLRVGRRSNFSDAQLEAIGKLRGLKSLSLAGVAGPGLGALAGLTELRSLDLSASAPTLRTLVELPLLPALSTLDLSNADGLADLGSVGRQPRLHSLRLRSLRLPEGALGGLLPGASLRRLDLSASVRRSSDLAPLANLRGLETLLLSQGSFPEDGLAPLARLTNLRKLSLDLCGLRGPGLRHLAGLTALEKLDLSRNLRLDGKHLAALAKLAQLRVLDVAQCDLSDAVDGLVELTSLAKLEVLDLSETKLSGGLAEAFALQFDELRVLRLGRLPDLADASFAHQDRLQKLSVLSLRGSTLDDAALQALLRCHPKLIELDLAFCPRLTDASARALARTSLRRLNLARCPRLTDAGLRALAECRSLESLGLLGARGLSDAAVERFRAARPDCALEH